MLGLNHPLPCKGRGGGAGIDNNFSEFFPSRYKLFFIIEKSRSSLETIGELLVVTTAPVFMQIWEYFADLIGKSGLTFILD